MMMFLIILKNGDCFETDYYDYENNFSNQILLVINQYKRTASTDGILFKKINQDHL